jgi:hypothetical protein
VSLRNAEEPDVGGDSSQLVPSQRRRWRWLALAAGVPFAIALFFAVTVFTGFPGLRP